MSDLVSINFTDLETISKGCKNRGDLAEIFDEIKKDIKDLHFQFSFSGNMLNGGSGNETQKAFSELLDEIDHNIRGIDNNVNDFGKSIGKYLDHMDGILEVPNIAMNVTVDKGIEDRKDDVNDIEDDYLSIISKLNNSIITPKKSLIIPPSDKEEYEQRLLTAQTEYSTINSTISDIYVSISSFNEEMSNIKDDLKQLGKFIDKDDFKPDRLKKFVGTVAVIGISVVYPPAGIAIVVVVTVKKEFHDGRTLAKSIALGAAKGVTNYALGKLGGFAGTKIKAVGKRGTSALSKTKLGKGLSSSTSKITSKASTAKTSISNSTSKLKGNLSISSKATEETLEVTETIDTDKRQLLSDGKRTELKGEYSNAVKSEITKDLLKISGAEEEYNDSVVKSDIIQNGFGFDTLNAALDEAYTDQEFEAALDRVLNEIGNKIIWE
ncbi:hypothetical protein R2F61_04030 [Mollicutes bacterium LVI A0078]|nr:hypothetical protein RZE84_04050 [Mollicutes bacterium LVI A0075]WOO91731.1 hypothetical protein R2F61_04030 [Mollicutes bacterium LVI A0078]